MESAASILCVLIICGQRVLLAVEMHPIIVGFMITTHPTKKKAKLNRWIQNSSIIESRNSITLPETNIFASRNGWLEYDHFLLGFSLFSGETYQVVVR